MAAGYVPIQEYSALDGYVGREVRVHALRENGNGGLERIAGAFFLGKLIREHDFYALEDAVRSQDGSKRYYVGIFRESFRMHGPELVTNSEDF